jgi:hypothetical protein
MTPEELEQMRADMDRLANDLWHSDAASALTNRAARAVQKLVAEVLRLTEANAALAEELARMRAAVGKLRRVLMPVAMELHQAQLAGQELQPDTVLFSFMGSGASDQVTLEMFLEAEEASRAALSHTGMTGPREGV